MSLLVDGTTIENVKFNQPVDNTKNTPVKATKAAENKVEHKDTVVAKTNELESVKECKNETDNPDTETKQNTLKNNEINKDAELETNKTDETNMDKQNKTAASQIEKDKSDKQNVGDSKEDITEEKDSSKDNMEKTVGEGNVSNKEIDSPDNDTEINSDSIEKVGEESAGNKSTEDAEDKDKPVVVDNSEGLEEEIIEEKAGATVDDEGSTTHENEDGKNVNKDEIKDMENTSSENKVQETKTEFNHGNDVEVTDIEEVKEKDGNKTENAKGIEETDEIVDDKSKLVKKEDCNVEQKDSTDGITDNIHTKEDDEAEIESTSTDLTEAKSGDKAEGCPML